MGKAVFCIGMFIIIIFYIPALAVDQPFAIDTSHIYTGMDRPYGQGYIPAASGNTLIIVLPLLSDAAAGDITATLTPRYPASAPFKLQGLEKRFSKKEYRFSGDTISAYLVSFKLTLYPSRLSGEYPLVITVSGKDGHENALSQDFYLEAAVSGGREDNDVPRAEITSFFMDGDHLNAGEAGEIRLTVKNESENRALDRLSVKLQDASGDVLPLHTDTVQIGRLSAGENAECVIPVTVSQTASAKLHTIDIALQYTYGGGKPANASVKYTVDVRQPVSIAYTEAALPVRVTQGDVPSFTMTLMNMGKSIISNALLTFDIPGLSNGGSVLAGTIAPGESKAASTNFRVLGSALGEVHGSLTISYDDAYGEAHEINLPLYTVIEEKVVPVYKAQDDGQDKKQHPLWIPYSACALLAILFILQRIWLLRKIRILEERHL